MTTATLASTPVPENPAIPAAAPRRAMLALARVEAVRLLRHPLTVAAILFLLGIWASAWFTNQANHYPVLQDIDRDSDLGIMLLLGGAALVAGNLAVLRAHRDGTTGLGEVLLLPERDRTLAHLLALLPLAVLGAVLVIARVAVLAVLLPAAGHPSPYELATGPATVLVLGTLGVLLGRLTRSAIAAPLAVLAVLASLVVLPLLTSQGRAQWLQPVVPAGDPNLPVPVPAYLMARPAGAHLGYLLGVAGLFAVAALVRSGARGGRIVVAGLAALACVGAGATGQALAPDPAVLAARVSVTNHPSQHQTCRTLDHVRYCAFTDFARWVPGWNSVVQEVLAPVPDTARPPGLTIRQRVALTGTNDPNGQTTSDEAQAAWQSGVFAAWKADDAAAGTPGAVTVGTRWGDSRSAVILAALVAYRVVTAGPAGPGTACGGRGVLVVWLAGQAGALTDTGLRKLAADQQGGASGVSFDQAGAVSGVDVPQPELAVGLAALDQPATAIAAKVRQSWSALTAPGTTAERAAQILGVPAPPSNPDGPGTRGQCR